MKTFPTVGNTEAAPAGCGDNGTAEALRRVVRRALARSPDLYAYTTHLLYEAVLGMPVDAEVAEWQREIVCRTLKSDWAFVTLPFSNLRHALGELLLVPEHWEAYLEEVRAMLRSRVVSAEGAWMHPVDRTGGGWALLVDSFQEEVSRLAKGARLVRLLEGDAAVAEAWERMCAKQFRVHRAVLRNGETGLWHNGRGWIAGEPGRLSPGAWSRGHGWLVRGMVLTMESLEAGGAARGEVGEMLAEVSGVLAGRQDAGGLWSVLLEAPGAGFVPESSGTAMVAAGWLRAVRLGMLPEGYRERGLRAAAAVAETCVDAEGRILSVSPGPGPLRELEPYREGPMRTDDPHGWMAAGLLLRELMQEEEEPDAGF